MQGIHIRNNLFIRKNVYNKILQITEHSLQQYSSCVLQLYMQNKKYDLG